ncbi:MAG: AAA family ATPase [Gammaproteobacteria bacterium]
MTSTTSKEVIMRKVSRHLTASDSGQPSRPVTTLSPLLYLWILRILVPLKGHTRGHDLEDLCSPYGSIVDALGALETCPRRHGRIREAAMLKHLRELHVLAEKEASKARLPRPLSVNCARIADLVGLDSVSARILAFVVLLQLDEMLQEAADLLGTISTMRLYGILSVLLGMPKDVIRQALAPSGVLAQSGLVKVDHSGEHFLRLKLDLINNRFSERMTSKVDDPLELFRDTLLPAPAAELSLADFEHAQGFIDIVFPLLRKALAERRSGVNVLLYGQPGTGKSQFVYALAKALGRPLYQVSSEDEDGDPIGGDRRLRVYRLALSVVGRGQALLVFDESEDVFSGGRGLFSPPSVAQRNKAWVNRTLEGNAIPCLWLTNSIDDMDPAFIRRFDVVYELPISPQRQRARVIGSICDDLVSPAAVRRLASAETLAPAVVARAVAVARAIREDVPAANMPSVIAQLVDQTLIAQGHPPLPPSNAASLDDYDPLCAPPDTDLVQLAEGIASAPGARVCLFGPPGTGKTAFARWLAQQLDRPLLVQRVSDLIGPYVGESERRLADAFRRAAQERAVLLLDEVDSFLQDRQEAQRSWEVTLVNEMLTQMETFEGVFIATTNRMERLDPAALRRFDLKLTFDYLQPSQAWQLLCHYAQALGLQSPEESLKPTLDVLTVLTPGDFATVARQARFLPIRDASALVETLAAECAAKPEGTRRPIGFI